MRALTLGLIGMLAAAGAAEAQTDYRAPRTADGHPDFGGVWSISFITQIERPPTIPAAVVPRDQAEAASAILLSRPMTVADPDFEFYALKNLAEVRGTLRASLLVEPADGQVPFTPRALELAGRADELFERGFDNPEERDTAERCISGFLQAPIRTLPIVFPVQVVQTADAIALTTEDVAGFRLIHLNGEPPPAILRSRDGWASGRWEGDTLVVTTTHLDPSDPYRVNLGRALVVGPDSRIVERFTRVSDTELNYQYTIEDPAFYAAPWRVEFSFTRQPAGVVYEYACHEANYSLANMMKAGREMDRRQAATRR